jgi:ribosomal RNA-processing protein 9
VTSVSLSSDASFVISGSKDNSVIRWDSETGEKTYLLPRWTKESAVEHSRAAEILATAISTDMKYCATGGRDKLIRIFDLRSNVEVKAFEGHRDAVTSLAFRHGSYSLYSSSFDRCVKHWDLQEMGYLETLFGHQEGVLSVDCWRKDRPVTSSADRTIRSWNVSNDTHLVFRGHHSGIDTVQILTDDMMVSGGPDGSIRLWKETQKKSIAIVSDAHGHEASSVTARWICSLCAVKMSDLVLSGSNDGYLRFWSTKNHNGKYNFSNPFSFPIDGFINSISVSNQVVAVGTGREPKFGRWACEKGNKNKLVILRVPIIDEGSVGVDDTNT